MTSNEVEYTKMQTHSGNTITIPPVKWQTLLSALGYGIGMGTPLGILTGFGLPYVVPALLSPNWLATVIVTEVYLSFIAGHMIAFGGFRNMLHRLQLGPALWRQIGLALLLSLAMWAFFIITYLAFGSSWGASVTLAKSS